MPRHHRSHILHTLTTALASTAITSTTSRSSTFTTSVSTAAVSASSAVVSASGVVVSVSSAVVSVSGASSSTSSPAVAVAASTTAAAAASSCTFTSAASAIAGKTDCTSIVLDGIVVPAGTTLDMTDLTSGTTVTFAGTTTFGYEEWDGPLISFSGTDITITGASGHEIDCGGASWWDGEGSNGGVTKPKTFYAHSLIDSTISNLNVLNTPVQFMSIDGATNLKVSSVTMDNSAGTTSGLAANTDAFDIGDSTGVYITDAVITNQDDCVAVDSGTDISFTGGTCTGSHGLSIGSVGGRDDNTVANVYFADSKMVDGENGVRIKTVSGATGSVTNVTFSSITISGSTDYGIVVEQDYENGDPTGTPTNGVSVTDITFEDITGTVADGATDIYILCGDGSCSDWTWTGIDVTGGDTSTECENIPTGASCTG